VTTRYKLLQLLDGGRFQSGTELGDQLGVSRAAIQQHVAALRKQGLPIEATRRVGYRLENGVSLLKGEQIRRLLPNSIRDQLAQIKVLHQVDSTNSELLRMKGSMHRSVCLAEQQVGGRGRRGRQWYATPYKNLMMSMGWVYPEWPNAVSALGLVAALAAARALEDIGAQGVGIKWPNDLMWHEQKLGGILVDVSGEAGGTCEVVVGIGINVCLDAHAARYIDQPWADLTQIVSPAPERNLLAAILIRHLLDLLSSFPANGLAGCKKEWRARHVLEGKDVNLVTERETVAGRVVGVEDSGALMVRNRSGVLQRYFHGDVSIRKRS